MEELLQQILSEVKEIKTGQQCLENRMEKLDGRMDRMEEKLDSMSIEMRSSFKYGYDKLEEHKGIFVTISSEIKGLKDDTAYLSSKTGRHEMELNRLINRL